MRARRLTSRGEIQARLEPDRVWAAYALGDLEAGLFEQCEWYAAADALALVFRGLSFVPLFTMGEAAGIEALLRSLVTLPRFYLNQRPEHLAAVRKFYRITELRPMWRMALDRFHPAGGEVVGLGLDRLVEIQALYAFGGGDAFAPFQVATGYFYGVEREGRLASVAGVHLASRTYRVGAVGNVFTHPAQRGRGFAAAATSAVVAALLAEGIDTIVLNVEQGNGGAVRIYERLGFAQYCEFLEGWAERRRAPARDHGAA